MTSFTSGSRRKVAGIALATMALGLSTGAARAQPKNLGSYAGTVEVSESAAAGSYRARVKVSMPVSDRSGSAITAEFLAGEAPDASVLVSQWETFHRDKSADSGGKFNTTTCTLAAPEEIPMSATGVLNVDLKQKKHALSLTLLSTRQVTLSCVHSRSGAYKQKVGIALYMGTGVPGTHYETQLPFADAGRLAAKYTLMPSADRQGGGPIVQQWDLQLAR
jgi:hypothetical protein